MGGVISKGANGIGTLIGNAFVAPIKSVFGGSCEGVCSGTWDITCFIEHLCVSNLLKLLLVLGLCYITLLFFYLMFKVGICQCIARSLCKMCWAVFETYWFLFEDITCFLWHKLKNTKHVNRQRRRRHRFRDVEVGCSSDEESMCLEVEKNFNRRKIRRKRKDRVESSLYPSRQNRYGHHSCHNRSQRLKYSRQLQMRKLSNLQRESALFKKRRFR